MHTAKKPVLLVAAIALCVVSSLAGPERTARAENTGGSLAGAYRQSSLREEYTVQQWLPGCGPAPVSSALGGGEQVTVKEEGDELSFTGGGRVFRTNQCYDEMPTLARESHSREGSGRTWRTRCTTPPNDPRRASLNTLVSVLDKKLELVETGRYEIVLKEGRCVADVKRTRTYEVVSAAPPVASAAPPATPRPAETAKPCATPGEPARLEVRPSRKLMRTGETFTFHAIVRDAAGCPTTTATSWSSEAKPGAPTVEGAGKVTIPADAAEGRYELVATAAGKSTVVTVEVTSAAHYDALLAQSGLNAAGENEEAAVAVIATGSLGGAEAAAEGNARRRRNIFIGIVGSVALVLFALAVIGVRRSRRAAQLEAEAEERHERRLAEAEERRREKVARHAAAQRAHEESVERARRAAAAAEAEEAQRAESMVCPACRKEYPAGSVFCPVDGSRLGRAGQVDVSGPTGSICPTCKRGFDPGVRLCPHDGDELVPYAMRAVGAAASLPRGKICPTCGDRFDGAATFCGKDGTALVLIN